MSKFRNRIFGIDNRVAMCEYPDMPWDHEDKTLDGVVIFKPGTLVQASLTEHMLIDAEKPVIDPSKWIKTDFYVAEYGANPIVMVLDLDPLENYYQIALGEKKFWYPLKFISKPRIE